MALHSRRNLIIGNSGSGKSHLAKALAEKLSLPVVDLDDIFWLDGSYAAKRPADRVWAAIDHIRQRDAWIAEGVYGQMVERLMARAELLIWLALPWDDCARNRLERERVRHPSPSPGDEKRFEALMTYAASYDTRTNDISREGHQRLFDAFTGAKLLFESRAQVDAFIRVQP